MACEIRLAFSRNGMGNVTVREKNITWVSVEFYTYISYRQGWDDAVS